MGAIVWSAAVKCRHDCGYAVLKARLIARLDIKGPDLIKTVHCEGVRKLGDPAEFVRRYDEGGIDEIIYMDVVASLYGRNSLHDLVARTADCVFCPLCVGGGIRCVADGAALLRIGADKLAINTAAIRRPELINELAHKFGSQAVVIQIDAKRQTNDKLRQGTGGIAEEVTKGICTWSGYEAYCDGAREPTGKDAVEWAKEAAERGAGELLVTSIDHEGTGRNFDIALLRRVCSAVSVPVTASGGAGEPGHVVDAIREGHATGVAVAGLLHYNRATIREIKEAMVAGGIPTRLEAA